MSLITKGFPNVLLLAGFVHILSFTTLAQSDPTGTKRITDTYAITHATVFSSPGTSSRATIIIKNGLIEDIGLSPKIPIDAQIIDGNSFFVYPGFIDVAAHAGVKAPPTPEKPREFDPSDPPPHVAGITPYLSVLDYFDPEHEGVQKWRKEGFLMAQLIPQGEGMLTGKSAVVLYGQQNHSRLLAASAGLSAKFQAIQGIYPGTTLGVMAKWRDLYQNAKLAIAHQALFTGNRGIPLPEKDPVLESFYPLINKSVPLIFEVSDELQIRRAIGLQKEEGFRLILTGVNEGNGMIPEIRDAGVNVVLSLDLPDDKASHKEFEKASDEAKEHLTRVKDAYTSRLQLAADYEKAGIPFAFGTQSVDSDLLMKNIRLMIANGLSEEAALAALTINAARMLGMEEVSGSIENGKLANLVITTDSVFKKEAQIKQVFVGGHLFEYDTGPQKKENEEDDAHLFGTWDYTAETPEGSATGIMEFEKASGEIRGKISFDDPEGGGNKITEVMEIKWSDNSLEFKFNVDVKGMLLSVTVSGEVSGNEFKGKLTIPDFGSFPFSAIKAPEAATNHNY